MIKYMLDTNICIFTIKNKPQIVRESFNRHSGQLCISAITLMELIYGAEKSAAPEKNLSVVEGFVARLEVLAFDNDAAAQAGMIRSELARAGTPIGPYDQMIAGHARSQGLIVVTNNVREFERVSGLRIEDWVRRLMHRSQSKRPLVITDSGRFALRVADQFNTTAPRFSSLRRRATSRPAATTMRLSRPVARISTRWASWNSMMVRAATMKMITA